LAYKLELPPEVTGVHPRVPRVSAPEVRGSGEENVCSALDVQDILEYVEYPVKILDWAEKSTRKTTIRFCKVLWSNHSEREATWEKESIMREKYPHLFEPGVISKSQG
jgi:hypothetical protein